MSLIYLSLASIFFCVFPTIQPNFQSCNFIFFPLNPQDLRWYGILFICFFYSCVSKRSLVKLSNIMKKVSIFIIQSMYTLKIYFIKLYITISYHIFFNKFGQLKLIKLGTTLVLYFFNRVWVLCILELYSFSDEKSMCVLGCLLHVFFSFVENNLGIEYFVHDIGWDLYGQ
jgi:hypothetical protein